MNTKKNPKQKKTLNYSKEALELWNNIARTLDDNKCVLCGRTEGLAVHHLMSKERNQIFKYSIINAITLCTSCHRYGRISAHNTPESAYRFFEKLRELRPKQFEWFLSVLNNTEKVKANNCKEVYKNLLQIERDLKNGTIDPKTAETFGR